MDKVKTVIMGSRNLFGEALANLLKGSRFHVIATAERMQAVESLAPKIAAPDLILIDFSPNNTEDVQAIHTLRQVWPQAKVVVLASELCARRLSAALNADISGYATYDESADSLKNSLNDVMMGQKLFPRDLAKLLVSPMAQGSVFPGKKKLSPREEEILGCLVEGSSNKVIAIKLKITEATVKVHLKSLLRKINVVNRTQAAIWALNNGMGSKVREPVTEKFVQEENRVVA